MSMQSIWVRARDGALYQDPLLVFPEGFVCFSDDERPEIVLWVEPDPVDAKPPVNVVEVLARVFRLSDGSSSVVKNAVLYHSRSQRVMPGTDPWDFFPAVSYYFTLSGRIPRPNLHTGSQVLATRVTGAVMDLPPAPLDVHSIEMPK